MKENTWFHNAQNLLIKKFWILVLRELCPDFLLSTRIPLTDWQGLSVRNFELNITVYYQIFLQNGIKLVFVPSKLFSHCKNLVISFFFNKEYGTYDYLLFISLPTEVNNLEFNLNSMRRNGPRYKYTTNVRSSYLCHTEFKDIFVLVKIQLSLRNIFVRDCCKSSQNNAHYL